MSGMKHDATKQLELIADLVAEEVLSLSDADVMAGACSDDPVGDAERARDVYAKALSAVGRRRLAAARSHIRGASVPGVVPEALRSPSRAREYINVLVSKSPLMKEKVTLAARSGAGLSDADIQSLLEDLAALGELPDLSGEDA